MLILGILLFGMLVGAAAQLLLRTRGHGINWTTAVVAGLIGSFVGGLLVSLLSGDGLALRPSGIIGSLAGAILLTAIWQSIDARRPPAATRPAEPAARPGAAPPTSSRSVGVAAVLQVVVVRREPELRAARLVRVLPDVAQGSADPGRLGAIVVGLHVSILRAITVQHKRRLLTKDEALL